VIDNPIDPQRFDPARHEYSEARQQLGLDGGPMLGVVAQITPWKGQDHAIRVLKRFHRVDPTAKLLLVGETKFLGAATRFDNQAYERALHEAVDELGLQDSVVFLGHHDDVERIIGALDVLLVPSTEEPLGRTVVEAMAMGVPVVATDRGGPAEVIRDGRDGVVLPPDDVGAWAEAAVELSRRGRSLESREYAQRRFSPDRHAEQVVALYRRLLN
jgi:glycosyltransferase involved in cell wall biosynthesis